MAGLFVGWLVGWWVGELESNTILRFWERSGCRSIGNMTHHKIPFSGLFSLFGRLSIFIRIFTVTQSLSYRSRNPGAKGPKWAKWMDVNSWIFIVDFITICRGMSLWFSLSSIHNAPMSAPVVSGSDHLAEKLPDIWSCLVLTWSHWSFCEVGLLPAPSTRGYVVPPVWMQSTISVIPFKEWFNVAFMAHGYHRNDLDERRIHHSSEPVRPPGTPMINMSSFTVEQHSTSALW
jgi:hypothetical protein